MNDIDLIRQYFAAVENRASEEDITAFFHPDVIQEEFPNRFSPQGARRDFTGLMDASNRGRMAVENERYEIVSAMAQGGRVAMEVKWSAVLKIPAGTLQPGDVMSARLGIFIELRDGKIFRQRNYDCFDPF
ncbi:MAG: hypothetical protein JWO82_4432 [Akkermansiaceae bacterium]|nr:hypothetical protein [Akkermansiaceae bacterium]